MTKRTSRKAADPQLRVQALGHAVDLHRAIQTRDRSDVVATAEAFHAFLTGKKADVVTTQAGAA